MEDHPETVADIMSKPVITVTLQQRVKDVLKLLARKDISGVPVVDEVGKLIGMVSSLDMILDTSIGKSDLRLGELPLSISVEKQVVKFHTDEPIKKAILAIIKKRLGRVVVIDEEMKPVGIVSRSDILKYIVNEST